MDLVADRSEFLGRLAEGPAEKRRLEEELSHSRSTIDRAIGRLEAAGLVERAAEGYVATPTGRIAVERYRAYRREQHDVDAAGAVLSSLPADCAVPGDLVVGGDASPAEGEPSRVFERLGRHLRDADRYRAALPALGDSRHVRLLHARVTDGELTARVRLSPPLADRLCEEFPGLVADLLDARNCSLRRGDVAPYGLALAEKPGETTALLTAYEGGSLAGLVENDTGTAIDCAGDLLADSGNATPLDPPDGVDDAVTPPLDGTTRAALDAAGAVELDGEYFLDRTPGDPEAAWRLGFDPVDVYYGYATERVDTSLSSARRLDGDDRTAEPAPSEEGDGGRFVSAALTDRLLAGEDHLVVGPPGAGKSTVCQQVACRWVDAGAGTVCYREAGRDIEASLEGLADVGGARDGRVLVVVEDAADVTEAFLELLASVRDDPSVVVLGEARRGEWHDAVESIADPTLRDAAREALDTYELPSVDESTCRRAIETFEAATGSEIALSGTELGERVETDDGIGEMLVLSYQVVAHAAPRPWLDDPVGPSALDADVRDCYQRLAPWTDEPGPVDDGALAIEVGLLVATLAAAEQPVGPGLVHAVAAARREGDRARDGHTDGRHRGDRHTEDARHRAVEAVLDALEGRMVLDREGGAAFRTQHPLWATRFLEHAVDRAERETVAAFERAVNAVLSLADDPDRRAAIETWLGRESPAVERLGDEDHLEEFLTTLFGLGLDRSQLAPLFGTTEHSGIELPAACPTSARLEAASCRGDMWYDYGDLERAETELRGLIERAEDAEEPTRSLYLAEGNWFLGELVVDRGETERARELLTAALEAAREGDHRKREVGTLNSLAWVAMTDDEYDRAGDRLDAALAVATDLGVCGAHSDTLYYLARLEQFQGDLAAAEKWLDRAIEMDRELGMQYSIAASTKLLADVARERGAFDRAEEHYRRSLELKREVGDSQGTAHVLFALGELALSRGRLDEARRSFERSLDLAREYDMRRHEGTVRCGLGRLAVETGAFDEAETAFERARAIHAELDNDRGVAATIEGLGDLARERGRPGLARERYRDSVERYREIGTDGERLDAIQKLVAACRADSDDAAAREWHRRGERLATDLGRDEWGREIEDLPTDRDESDAIES